MLHFTVASTSKGGLGETTEWMLMGKKWNNKRRKQIYTSSPCSVKVPPLSLSRRCSPSALHSDTEQMLSFMCVWLRDGACSLSSRKEHCRRGAETSEATVRALVFGLVVIFSAAPIQPYLPSEWAVKWSNFLPCKKRKKKVSFSSDTQR